MKPLLLLALATFITFDLSAQKGAIKYENRTDILHADDCNASEVYLKKKIKAQLANYYTDYPFIYVDFTSFKGQNGFNDKTNPKKIVYPYKIEMLVYLKRMITKDGLSLR